MNDDTHKNRRTILSSEEDTQGGYLARPEVDENNMPRPPRRVTERDVEGTHVTPAAYREPTTSTKRGSTPHPAVPVRKKTSFNWQSGWGCLARGFIVALFGVIVLGLCGASVFIYEYFSIASTLPEIG